MMALETECQIKPLLAHTRAKRHSTAGRYDNAKAKTALMKANKTSK